MDKHTRNEIADLLIALAGKREWDHLTWKRCHELLKSHLDNDLIDAFYEDFLSHPGLFNIRLTAMHPTKVQVIPAQSGPAKLEAVCSEFTRVAEKLLQPE